MIFRELSVKRRIIFVFVITMLCTIFWSAQAQRRGGAAAGQQETEGGNSPLRLLQWRLIGPFRGGRVTAVTGVASQPQVYYFGATGGGVWKTADGGVNWEPITDNSVFGTGSVGAIGLSVADQW